MRNSTQERTNSYKVLIRLAKGLIVGSCVGTLVCLVVYLAMDQSTSGTEGTQRFAEYAEETDLDSSSSGEGIIREFLSNPNSSLRISDIYSHIYDLDKEKLFELIRLTGTLDWNSNVAATQELLIGELAFQEPRNTLSAIWELPRSQWTKLVEIVFSEWSHTSLNRALQAAAELKGHLRDVALRTIVAERYGDSATTIMNIANSLGIESNVAKQVKRNLILSSLDQPHVAWDLAIQAGVNDVDQVVELARIVKAWRNKQGWEVLHDVYDNFHHNNYSLFDELLTSIVGDDPMSAYEYALAMPVEKRGIILPSVLRIWAEREPRVALEETSRIARNSIRERAQLAVSQVWAAQDPIGLIDSLQVVPRKSLQDSLSVAIRNLSKHSPQLAAERMQDLSDQWGGIPIDAEFALIEEWAVLDVNSAIDWVNENAVDRSQKRTRLMQRVVSRHAIVDAKVAMQVALAEEPHEFHSRVGLETYVIQTLVNRHQIDDALELMKQVRESARPSSSYYVGEALLNMDRISDVVEIATQMSNTDQVDYFYLLSYEWLLKDPQQLLDTLATLPSRDVRTDVAELLLQDEETLNDTITERQLESLRAFTTRETEETPQNF